MYSHIINPSTNRNVSIYSKKGQEILKKYILRQIGGKKNCPNCYAFTKDEKSEIRVLKKIHPRTKGTQREQMICEKYGHKWTQGIDSIRNIGGDCCKCWCCGKLDDSSTSTIPSPSKPKPSSMKSPPKPDTKSNSDNSSTNSLENKMQCPHCLEFNDLSPTMICIHCGKDMLTTASKRSPPDDIDTCYFTPSGKKRNKGPRGKACKNKNLKERCCLNTPHNDNCQWCEGDGCRSIETKCGTKSGNKGKKLTWKPSGKKGRSVTKVLREYIDHISNGTHLIGAIESGGGGDCLYHSISNGLGQIKQQFPSVIGMLESLYNGDQEFDMMSLRRISSLGLDNITNDAFINHYINFLGQESSGAWMDKWSPKAIVNNLGGNIVNIAKYNVVNSVINLTNGNVRIQGNKINIISSGKSICSACNALVLNSELNNHKKGRCRSARFREHFVNQEQKNFKLIVKPNELEKLKIAVKHQIMIPRNHHWGIDLDIINISNMLGIGIIVLRSMGDPLFYCLSNDNSRFNYYMIIYNQDGAHYQLGVIKNRLNNSEHSFYGCNGLPIWLKEEYNRLCKENSIICPPSINL